MNGNNIAHGTTCYLNVQFTDKDGEPSAPISVEYKVVNPDTGAVLLDWTDTGTPTATMSLEIGKSVNTIATLPTVDREIRERRRALVHAVFGAEKELQGHRDYYIVAVFGAHA
jgi:hypothetical protein